MIPWNNRIMKKYGVSIRIAIFRSYYNGYLRAMSISNREREEKLQRIMDEIPDDKWVEC